MAERIKVVIKVVNYRGRISWTHLTYCNRELYLRFLEKFEISRADIADYVGKWVQSDFGVELTMTQASDIEIFKDLVEARYKIAYPKVFSSSSVYDRQGWVRVYLEEHMEKELEKIGEL